MLRGLAELAKATAIGSAGTRVDIGVRGEELTVSSRVATNLAIVVNELVANAVEHAFADRDHGQVHLSLGRAEDGWARIEVADNGRGCPPEVIEGTGLLLSRSIVESDLAGVFHMENVETGGCISRVRFPLAD
jgi:two-component sensor histidine kinase